MTRIVHKEKVFRDPLHDLIVVAPEDRFIVDLVDAAEMQRLRRIKQLGVSCFTYQGAEHSRFAHSVGVYWCVCRILSALRRNHSGEKAILKVLDEIARPVKAAGLLHDIGHGPFSHVFEGATGIKHEQWTERIIEDPTTDVNKALLRAHIAPKAVADIIRKSPGAEQLAIDIISSELDADRMDYLLRDSLMCGVTYGQFDLEWMLHVMHAAYVDAPSENGTGHFLKLCADARRGSRAVEEYVLARIQMYEQVYFHKTTRAIEGLLSNILKYAQWLVREQGWSPPNTSPQVLKLLKAKPLTVADYLALDDYCLSDAVSAWAHMPRRSDESDQLAELAQRFVHRRKTFGCIDVTENRYSAGRLLENLDAASDTLRFHCFLDSPSSTVYKGVLYSIKKDKEPEDRINATIYVLQNGRPIPVEAQSTILRQLSGETFETNRLYYDRDKQQEFTALFSKFQLD